MKSILTIADGGPALDTTLSHASIWADLFGAIHNVVHVRDEAALKPSKMAADFAVAGAAAAGVANFEWNEKFGGERASAAQAAYRRVIANSRRSTFREVEARGHEAAAVVQLGRVSDLIVVARPGSDPAKPEPAYVSAAIFETARPVLVAPPTPPRAPLVNAVIAWNGAAQAARAVGYALPLLQHAQSVTVLSIGPRGHRAASEQLIRYLAAHGIEAHSVGLDLGQVSARARGRGLLTYLHNSDADLLVTGAYGDGALAKFLGLGGATSKIITASKVPVFIAH
jgi:nucleotide-binding universal stress UspA family protein